MQVDFKPFFLKPIVPKLLLIGLFICLIGVWVFGIREIQKDNADVSIAPEKPLNLLTSSTLKQVPLFGEYVPLHLNDSEIAQSRLDFVVEGILASENEKDSQVIISASGKSAQIYTVGDSLPGQIIIKRITPDGVLILRNGALERLSLPKNEVVFEPLAKPLVGE